MSCLNWVSFIHPHRGQVMVSPSDMLVHSLLGKCIMWLGHVVYHTVVVVITLIRQKLFLMCLCLRDGCSKIWHVWAEGRSPEIEGIWTLFSVMIGSLHSQWCRNLVILVTNYWTVCCVLSVEELRWCHFDCVYVCVCVCVCGSVLSGWFIHCVGHGCCGTYVVHL